jgi:hypothetical protein
MSLEVKVDVPAAVTEAATSFTLRVLGPLAEASDLLSDRMRFFRWKSAVKTLAKAKEFADKHGFKPKQIPLKQLVPLIEGASLEEEDSELVEKWAALIAHASDEPEHKYVFFAQILSSLDGSEVKLLDELWRSASEQELFRIESLETGPSLSIQVQNAIEDVCEAIKNESVEDLSSFRNVVLHFWRERDVPNFQGINFSDHDQFVYWQHLDSLQLVRTHFMTDVIRHSKDVDYVAGRQERVFFAAVELTRLGYQFVSACNGPKTRGST